uniref:Uncharacterized protein n=1 Tax=Physcomitrium patens TaxID=3218 RepID=A0A2K1IFG4_PHYPA|nr:hypothetical protein PHYPA_028607 [Physcomitrium patens]
MSGAGLHHWILLFSLLYPDVSNDSVSKLRQRTRTDTPEGKDVSSPVSSPFVSESPTSHVLTSRVQPQQQEVQHQAMWTKSNPRLDFTMVHGLMVAALVGAVQDRFMALLRCVARFRPP